MPAVPPMITRLARTAAAVLCPVVTCPAPALAQTDVKLERVEVTGSSIKRIDAETALPVQILTREEIQRTGATNAEQLLKTVSATSTFGASTVAGTGPGGGQGGNNSVSLLSLRGLGSARTLVLINGRRSAPAGGSSAVDIATIPVSAIERVEVLKDGASAVYGSDAVAGVVNFILRKDVGATEVTTTIGTPTRSGGGREAKITLFTGFGDIDADRYSVTLGASYATVKPIFGRDRSFARNIDVDHLLDKTNATATFPANFRLIGKNGVLGGTTFSANYPNCGPFSLASPLLPGVCRYDNAPYDALQPDTKLGTVAANGRFNLGSGFEAYAEGSLARNTTLNTVQHVLINGAQLATGHPYIASLTNLLNTQYPQFPQLKSLIGSGWALLPPTSPYYPTAFVAANGLVGQPLVLQFRSVQTGLRQTEDVADNQRLVLGARGAAAGWDLDAGLLYSQNKITTTLKQGWVLTDPYLNLVNTGVINPFGDTANKGALDAAMATNYNDLFSVITTQIRGIDAKAARELVKLPAGTVNLAIGGELRKESLEIRPSDANKRGLIAGFGGVGGVETIAERKVTSAYAEVNVPILKGLELDAAVRTDKYENVGSSTNPKLSLRFQPLDQLLMRAAVGTGFRAPTLLDLYQPRVQGVTTNGQRDRLRCPTVVASNVDCSTQYNTLNGGNPELKPEKSRSITLGLVFEPTKDLTIGIDYFNIRIKEIITSGAVSVANILADPTRYSSLLVRGPSDSNASGVGPILGIQQGLVNLGKTVVAGTDLDIKARLLNTPENKLTFKLNGTYLSKYDRQQLDQSYVSALNSPANGSIGVALRWRHAAGVTWDTGPWSATLLQNFQVGYNDVRTALEAATVTPRRVSPYTTYDLQASYIGFKAVRLTLGVKNVTDRDPPYTNYGGGFVGGYDLSYTDVRGRFVYLTAGYTFK